MLKYIYIYIYIYNLPGLLYVVLYNTYRINKWTCYTGLIYFIMYFNSQEIGCQIVQFSG